MPLAENGIWYADHRQSHNPRIPVLMIHGAGGSRLDWPVELRRMPDANAIVPDLPGHGRSTAPARDRVEEYASDLIHLLDVLHIARVILLGHSLGGAIAIQIALDFPERAAGLVLIGTGAKLSVHPDILDGLTGQPQQTVSMIVNWQWPDGFEGQKMLGTQRLLTLDSHLLLRDFQAANAFDARGQLERIQPPTLVIGGTADQMTPFKYSEYLSQHIPNAQLIQVAGGGHMMMLEQPQVVAAAVQSFLKSL